jgi:hypothetical protein
MALTSEQVGVGANITPVPPPLRLKIKIQISGYPSSAAQQHGIAPSHIDHGPFTERSREFDRGGAAGGDVGARRVLSRDTLDDSRLR